MGLDAFYLSTQPLNIYWGTILVKSTPKMVYHLTNPPKNGFNHLINNIFLDNFPLYHLVKILLEM